MISGPRKPRGILSFGQHERNKGENRTDWDFQLRRKLNRLAHLNYAIRGRIVLEALKMEDENGRKRLNLHLLDRLSRAGLVDQYGLRP
jgi:hypothetical protein